VGLSKRLGEAIALDVAVFVGKMSCSKYMFKEGIIMLSLTIPDSVLHSLKLPEKTLPNDLMKLLAVEAL
jgi:hypothetical protein